MELHAWRTETVEQTPDMGVKIVPAHPQRQWMNNSAFPAVPGDTPEQTAEWADKKGIANRCLPLLMANQIGWNIVTTYEYAITSMPDGMVAIHWSDPRGIPPVAGAPRNNFGSNIVSWSVPWVLRTPPGWDLLIQGPANYFLPPGVTPLSGLVETDQEHTSFTMNWHITPRATVWVSVGDVIATIIPFPTAELEKFTLVEHGEPPEGHAKWYAERFPKTKNPRDWLKEYWDSAKRRKIRYGGTDD